MARGRVAHEHGQEVEEGLKEEITHREEVGAFGHNAEHGGAKQRTDRLPHRDAHEHWDDGRDGVHDVGNHAVEDALRHRPLVLSRSNGNVILICCNFVMLVEVVLLAHGVVDLADVGADNHLEAVSGMLDAENAANLLELVVFRKTLVLELKAQARRAMEDRDDIFPTADQWQDLLCQLLVLVHNLRSFRFGAAFATLPSMGANCHPSPPNWGRLPLAGEWPVRQCGARYLALLGRGTHLGGGRKPAVEYLDYVDQ